MEFPLDEPLRFALTLVDHGDPDQARRWFAAVDDAYQGPDGPVTSWDAFLVRFYDTAGSFDSTTVNWFVERMADRLTDPLDAVAQIHEIGPDRAPDAAAEARSADAVGEPGTTEAEVVDTATTADWDRFAALLGDGQRHHAKSWTFFRGWLMGEAAGRGLAPEADSFVAYVEAGADRAEALARYGGTAAAAEPEAREPDWAGFAALLTRGEPYWTRSWTFLRGWVLAEARAESLTAEAEAFVEYVTANGDVTEALYRFGAVAVPAAPTGEEIATDAATDDTTTGAVDQPEEPEYAQAAVAVQDIGVAALARLRAGRPDLTVTDDMLAQVLAERIQARSAR